MFYLLWLSAFITGMLVGWVVAKAGSTNTVYLRAPECSPPVMTDERIRKAWSADNRP